MKCPKCAVNHKYKDGMACACGYRFALDPKSDGMADAKFLAMLNSATGNDTNHITENQLYMVYCRQNYSRPFIPAVIALALLGLAIGLYFAGGKNAPIWAGLALAASMISALASLYNWMSSPPDREKFRGILEKWSARHGSPKKLIQEPALHEPPPEWQEPDIYDYGVERLLIVQHDILVDLFVKNSFHAEQRALILSENGYPKYLVPLAVKALQDNPQLPVFFLHDSTDDGVEMAARMGQSQFLAWQQHPQIDLGLFPDDVKRIGKLRVLKPGKTNYRLPVDAVPYAVLSVALTQSLADQVALGHILLTTTSGADSDGYIGFG